jgi:hypothetical protein
MTGPARFDTWAVLELMGHRRLAGFVSEVTIAGAAFLRIDIPLGGAGKDVTQYYSAAAVYALTPTSQATALELAAALAFPAPVKEWELPRIDESRDRDADVDDPADPY